MLRFLVMAFLRPRFERVVYYEGLFRDLGEREVVCVGGTWTAAAKVFQKGAGNFSWIDFFALGMFGPHPCHSCGLEGRVSWAC